MTTRPGGPPPARPPDPVGEIPGSFAELYRSAGSRGRLGVTVAELAERYDFCEDLAQLLSETARHVHLDVGLPRDEVLQRMALGLQGPDAGVDDAEAGWVLRRLAEILGWEPLAPVSRAEGKLR